MMRRRGEKRLSLQTFWNACGWFSRNSATVLSGVAEREMFYSPREEDSEKKIENGNGKRHEKPAEGGFCLSEIFLGENIYRIVRHF